MGKKKSQQHVQQSMGNMVSKAALAQLGPHIERYVQANIQQLGSQLAAQQSETLEVMFSRIVVLEKIVCDKLGYTTEKLAELVAEMEDSKENLKVVDEVQNGDVVRLEIKSKLQGQEEYQGSTRTKAYRIGSGQSLGKEIEQEIIGMKTGEVKTIGLGKDKAEATVEVVINRISRGQKPTLAEVPKTETTEASSGDQTPG